MGQNISKFIEVEWERKKEIKNEGTEMSNVITIEDSIRYTTTIIIIKTNSQFFQFSFKTFKNPAH